MIFIGADPGTINSGYSIIECKRSSINLIEIGMFKATITNLTRNPAKPPKSKRKKTKLIELIPPFNEQFFEFRTSWENILNEYKPIKVTVERFQSRGFQGSAVIEAVSLMNGVLVTLCHDRNIEFESHIASTWKNSLNKFLVESKPCKLESLDEIYTSCKPFPNHIVDSIFINLYGMLNYKNKKWADLNLVKLIKEIQKYEYEN